MTWLPKVISTSFWFFIVEAFWYRFYLLFTKCLGLFSAKFDIVCNYRYVCKYLLLLEHARAWFEKWIRSIARCRKWIKRSKEEQKNKSIWLPLFPSSSLLGGTCIFMMRACWSLTSCFMICLIPKRRKWRLSNQFVICLYEPWPIEYKVLCFKKDTKEI